MVSRTFSSASQSHNPSSSMVGAGGGAGGVHSSMYSPSPRRLSATKFRLKEEDESRYGGTN